jgi:hypothetical protein
MDQTTIRKFIVDHFAGVDVAVASQESGAPPIAWGDTFVFYDPDRNVPVDRRWPWTTIVTKDYGDFDAASNLNRPGLFRLNVGVSKETYRKLFGPPPCPGDQFDFTAQDQVLPHPVYSAQHWVCILNPTDATFQSEVLTLLSDAYNDAVRKHGKQSSRE